jgi:hypothetical protein
MVKRIGGIAALFLCLSLSLFADDVASRDKLIGSWEAQNAAADSPASAWTIGTKGDYLQVTQLDGDKKVAEFRCKFDGTPCEIKTDGKKATVSMWFNGAKLVQMETKGSNVIKRRFGVLASGNTMEMEVIPVVPSGKTETLQFKRVELSANAK